MTESDNSLESLLVRLLHHLGEHIPSQGVLKGGLVLRLLDCPRRTNDLDIVLLPFASKRDALPVFRKAIESFPCDGLEITSHSTAIRARVRADGQVAQVEASVAESCPTVALSTSSLAAAHRQLPRIVQVMRFDVALAHKLGAWMERELLRDLYDIFYWHGIQGVIPDPETLRIRLGHVRSRKHKAREWTLAELANHLSTRVGTLTDDELRAELAPVLPENELVGLSARIRGVVTSLTMRLAAEEVNR